MFLQGEAECRRHSDGLARSFWVIKVHDGLGRPQVHTGVGAHRRRCGLGTQRPCATYPGRFSVGALEWVLTVLFLAHEAPRVHTQPLLLRRQFPRQQLPGQCDICIHSSDSHFRDWWPQNSAPLRVGCGAGGWLALAENKPRGGQKVEKWGSCAESPAAGNGMFSLLLAAGQEGGCF